MLVTRSGSAGCRPSLCSIQSLRNYPFDMAWWTVLVWQRFLPGVVNQRANEVGALWRGPVDMAPGVHHQVGNRRQVGFLAAVVAMAVGPVPQATARDALVPVPDAVEIAVLILAS